MEGRQGLVGWDLRFRASGLVFRALGDALGGGGVVHCVSSAWGVGLRRRVCAVAVIHL